MDTLLHNSYISLHRTLDDLLAIILHMSDDLSINTIVIMTESGKMAIQMAQYRPNAQIYALCVQNSVFQLLSLIWGITSIFVDSFKTTDDMIEYSTQLLKDKGHINKGDAYIMASGMPLGVSGSKNMLKIHEV